MILTNLSKNSKISEICIVTNNSSILIKLPIYNESHMKVYFSKLSPTGPNPSFVHLEFAPMTSDKYIRFFYP
jgi:hypothetical protein